MEQYKTALILGYGRSGRAAEALLHAEGTHTVVFTEEKNSLYELQGALIRYSFDICIVSPGFPLTHPWIKTVIEAEIPMISELELGWSRHRGRSIAITGSNGKSTAVKWIAETLQTAGQRVDIGGNYGVPVSEVVLNEGDLDWLVIEASSFQLETVCRFRADIAVLLNVLPNHLNRHKTMDIYRQTKSRIFRCSLPEDCCIAPVDLLNAIIKDVPEARGKWISFGSDPEADFFYSEEKIFHNSGIFMNLNGTPFANDVLGCCTGAAVAAVLWHCGIAATAGESAAREFQRLPHRIEPVAEIDGVKYVNDSKATNLAAMAAALQTCGNNIHLIAGGRAKETDFTFIKEILAERVLRLYLIGEASGAMKNAWGDVCPAIECGTLEKAFKCAHIAARQGDTILLSPGCASFDQFQDFEHRGEQFCSMVRCLAD